MFRDFRAGLYTMGAGTSGARELRVPERLEFVAEGPDIAFINGLRRSILADVKTAAFAFNPVDPDGQDVKFKRNTTPLHNEILGARVGLLPIHLNRETLAAFEPGDWRFELQVRNEGAVPQDVTTADIRVFRVAGGGVSWSKHGESQSAGEEELPGAGALGTPFPPDPLTGDHPIIAVLMPPSASTGVTHEIAFEARASVGSGSDHARYCPVSVCAFAPEVDEALAAEMRAAAEDRERFDLLLKPHAAARLDPVTGRPVAYRFFLETACGLSPRDIVTAGFESLAARLRAAAEELGDPELVRVEGSSMAPDVHGVRLRHQSSTVGAVLQAELLEGDKAQLEMLGYHNPHPLEPYLLVRGRGKNGAAAEWDEFRLLLRAAAERGALRAERMADEWKRATERVPGVGDYGGAAGKGRRAKGASYAEKAKVTRTEATAAIPQDTGVGSGEVVP